MVNSLPAVPDLLVNERNVLPIPRFKEVFAAKGVTLMKGRLDNPRPGHHPRALPPSGRAALPLYVVYHSKPVSPKRSSAAAFGPASVVQRRVAARTLIRVQGLKGSDERFSMGRGNAACCEHGPQ